MRVVAIVPGDRFSGPAGQVVSTAPALGRLGVDLRFVLLRRPGATHGQLPSFLERRGIVHTLVPDRGPLDPALSRRVRRVLDDWRPAIVETHGYKASSLALRMRFRRPGWQWVGYFHGFTAESRRAGFYHWLDVRMLKRADAVVSMSEEQRRTLGRVIPDVRLIRNAVTLMDEPSGEAQPWLASVTDLPAPRIAVVGRLSPEKGVDVFLHALAGLASRGLACSAVVAGDGSERVPLEALARSLGLEDRVRFIGYITHVRPLYDHIQLLVIPSRSEGLPSVLLEALASNVAVVSTSVGSIPEVLAAHGAGVLAPPDSPRALANSIEHALAGLDIDDARDARARTADAYSQERRAAALVALYRELIERKGGRSLP